MLGTPNTEESRGQRNKTARAPLGAAARYGFRRIEHVHIRIDNGSALALVTGIAHRYPRTVRVPLAVAARLVASGAPHTIERIDPPKEKALV